MQTKQWSARLMVLAVMLGSLWLLATPGAPVWADGLAGPLVQDEESSYPFISEVAPAAGNGQSAWIELAIWPLNTTHTVYLPIILRNSDGSSSSNSPVAAKAAGPLATQADNTIDLRGYILTDEDGNSYTIPAGLPPLPPGSIVLIKLESGADDLNITDGQATLFAPALTNAFEPAGDQLALYSSSVFSTSTLVDFLAWGDDPGPDDDLAVEASLWGNGDYHIFDQGFGEQGIPVPTLPNATIGRYDNSLASYYPADSSPGTANPMPAPLNTTAPDGIAFSADTFGIGWSGVEGAAVYEFELAATADFTNPIVNITTPYVGWVPTSPLPDGDYFWRARAVSHSGEKGQYIGPLQIGNRIRSAGRLSAAATVKTLLDPSEYKIQRKDTTMLNISGRASYLQLLKSYEKDGELVPLALNFKGSTRTGTRDRWDGPHVFSGGEPSFKWNGYDNIYCARASAAMIVDYYGGKLSQDRLSYYWFEENIANDNPTKGIPEDDMGFGRGANTSKMLAWGLGAEVTTKKYCPKPDVDNYCAEEGAPTITFDEIQALIDDGKPFASMSKGHARVTDGYRINNDNSKDIHELDPVPVGLDSCTPGACSGERWIPFDEYKNTVAYISYLKDGATANPRSDEKTIAKDSDNDGVNDFDEIYRFKTSPYLKDTDGDTLDDKEEIASYTFVLGENQTSKIAGDSLYHQDGIRKELDWDDDNDGTPDGCEDQTGNYLAHYSEKLTKVCEPHNFAIIGPTTQNPKKVGPRTQPVNFWAVSQLGYPASLPKSAIPQFDAANFEPTISVGVKQGVNIYVTNSTPNKLNYAQAPGLIGLKINPPKLSLEGKVKFTSLTMKIMADGNEIGKAWQDDSLIYGPAKFPANMLLVDNAGNGGIKFSAMQSAAQMFLSQWGPGDNIGLISLGGGSAALLITPTTVTTNGRSLNTMRATLDGLTPGDHGDLPGGLALAQQQFEAANSDGYPRNIVLAALGASDITTDATTLHGDYNLDGHVDAVDFYTTTNSYSGTAIYPVIVADDPTAPWIGTLDNTAGPALAGSLNSNYNSSVAAMPATFINQMAGFFKTAAEQLRGERRLLQATGTLTGLDRYTHTVRLDEATTIAFTANFSETGKGSLEVFRPNGQPVDPSDADTQFVEYGHHVHFRISNPASGTWKLVIQGTNAAGGAVEYIAFASADSRLDFGFVPGLSGSTRLNGIIPQAFAGTGQILHNFNGWASYTPVAYVELITGATVISVTAEIFSPDSATPTALPLFDDGLHSDGSAGDGLYGGDVFSPTVSGAYLVLAALHAQDDAGQPLTRYAQESFFVQKPLAYIFGPGADLTMYQDYVELLADGGVGLTGVAQEAITGTDWSQFDAVLIASDSGSTGSSWGSATQRAALNGSGLPLIGLGEGGYALFGDLELNIGSNGIVQNSGLGSVLPQNAVDAIWSTPYLPNGSAPYLLYADTAGIRLNLAGGATVIGLDNGTSQPVIARESGRYALWGFAAGPAAMTADGRRIFLNLTTEMLGP